MANFSCQACLTSEEQIVKYYLKLLSRNCRHCAASLTAAAWLTHQQSYRRVCGTFHHLTSFSHGPIQFAACNRRLQRNVAYIFFVYEYAIQFSTEDCHCENLYKGDTVWKVLYEILNTLSRCCSSFDVLRVERSFGAPNCNMPLVMCGNVRPLSFHCFWVRFFNRMFSRRRLNVSSSITSP
jgi:hypothetical protein